MLVDFDICNTEVYINHEFDLILGQKNSATLQV